MRPILALWFLETVALSLEFLSSVLVSCGTCIFCSHEIDIWESECWKFLFLSLKFDNFCVDFTKTYKIPSSVWNDRQFVSPYEKFSCLSFQGYSFAFISQLDHRKQRRKLKRRIQIRSRSLVVERRRNKSFFSFEVPNWLVEPVLCWQGKLVYNNEH